MNNSIYAVIGEIIKTIFFKVLEFVFLLLVMFISFLSLRTPYEVLEDDLKEKGDKSLSDLNIFRRFFSFFFFGAPLIYFGLRLTNPLPLAVDLLQSKSILELILNIISIMGSIKGSTYLLILIPFFVILILKYQLEDVWSKLNKESKRLFNHRLIEFRDQRLNKSVYTHAKEKHRQEFIDFTINIIKNSSIVFTVCGAFLVFLISTIFGGPIQAIINYLVPLYVMWMLPCLFLTVFEKTISETITRIIEARTSKQ